MWYPEQQGYHAKSQSYSANRKGDQAPSLRTDGVLGSGPAGTLVARIGPGAEVLGHHLEGDNLSSALMNIG